LCGGNTHSIVLQGKVEALVRRGGLLVLHFTFYNIAYYTSAPPT